MIYLALVLMLALGYVMGLLHNGININDYRFPQEETDKDGNPIYNKSVSSLTEEQEEWINENRR